MSDMISAKKLRAVKAEHPNAAVVCYVNSSAEVKAESDICCTSSNAIKVVNSLEAEEILFVPDQFLGQYVANHTDKKLILYKGFCPTHYRLREEDIEKVKKEHPDAEVIAHPECAQEVLQLADHVFSTAGMLDYARDSKAKKFIIATEMGLLYKLRQDSPDKEFFLASEHLVCANMKLTTLGWVIDSLKNMQYVVTVDPAIREKARIAVQRMLDVS